MTAAVAVLVAAMGLHLGWTWLRATRAPTQVRRPRGTPGPTSHDDPVCVIVPAWNDAAVLTGTLDALRPEVARAPAGSEVVIVAGGADGTFGVAERFAARGGPAWRVLRQEPRGKNAALNLALAASDAPLVVFLDADTRVRPGWLEALVAPIRRGVADATSGRFRASRATAVSRVFELDQLVSQRLQRADVLFGGATIALHRRVLARLGGRLPEEVVVGVDWDLSARVARAGLRRRFVGRAEVVTEVPQSWREYWRTEVRWRRAHLAASLRRWRERRDLASTLDLVYLPLAQGILLAGPVVLPLLALPFGAAGEALVLWAAFAAWLVGRHVSRCLMGYRADGNVRWLRLMPAYALAFCLSAAASWAGLLSLGRLSPHFKGRRSAGVS